MNQLESINAILTQLKQERQLVRNELRNYPNERLMLTVNHGAVQKILVREDGSRKGIGKDPEHVHKLAQKAYLLEYGKRIQFNIDLLNKLQREMKTTSVKEIIDALPKHYDRLPQEFFSVAAVRNYTRNHPWSDENAPIRPAKLSLKDQTTQELRVRPYKANAVHPENKAIRTSSGLMVRSKSEAAIAELYEKHGVPFHYDEVLDFDPLLRCAHPEMPKELNKYGTVFSPDFVAARRDGRLIYHEHAGLMSERSYAAAFQNKLRSYAACGIVPWDNLIISYDGPDGSLDLKLIEAEMESKGLIFA